MERLVGKKAPDFKLAAVSGDGNSLFNLSLGDYQGRWLVLMFYGADFGEIPSMELTTISRISHLFESANCSILAIGSDSHLAHKEWIHGLGKINFPVGSDATTKIAEDYGLLIEDQGIALGGLFIIDADQIVRYSVIHDLKIARNIEETYRMLKALQTDGLCGVNWVVPQENL